MPAGEPLESELCSTWRRRLPELALQPNLNTRGDNRRFNPRRSRLYVAPSFSTVKA
jgi:hypothetical protein